MEMKMTVRLKRGVLLCVLSLLLAGAVVLPHSGGVGAWSVDPTQNTTICNAPGYQEVQQLIPDGSGGAIITWADYRSGTNYDIYAQRVDSAGTKRWTANGVAICTEPDSQYSPDITSDGSGGAIITWDDARSVNYDIYAQRVDSAGAVKWTANGVLISTASGMQRLPRIVSDGSGGAIVAWADYRSGNADIYAQRVDSTGAVKWTADGVGVCTAPVDQDHPRIISDGSGGAIITWYDYRGGSSDIYAQRVDSAGAVKWTANGVAICTDRAVNRFPQIISDGSGGAIITWADYRSGTNDDIYAQRVDSTGAVKWTANGVGVCTAPGSQYPEIISDGSGGAIITWQDYRNGNYDIYAQRVDSAGVVKWTANGVAICTAPGAQESPRSSRMARVEPSSPGRTTAAAL
jgi:hypothetical protein